MSIRFYLTIGFVGWLIGVGMSQCYQSKPENTDCRYERFYADIQSQVANGVIMSAADMLLAVQQDCLDTCRAQLKHCGCLRGQDKQDEIESQ